MRTRLKRIWWNYSYAILPVGVMVGLVLGLVLLLYALDSAACSAKWGERGQYAFYTGCMVDGIPDENIRILIGK